MIYLNTSTRSLTAVLAAATSTVQLDFVTCYYDVPTGTKDDNSEYLGASFLTNSAGTNSVIVVPAPPGGVTRNIMYVSGYNADTTSVTLKFRFTDTGTSKVVFPPTLTTGQLAAYESDTGWYVK